ncbi:MFS family transport protein [Salmonella enterica subsp. enterica]|nr:MFS family transport protein [Salmonella enterica subsp. enterica]
MFIGLMVGGVLADRYERKKVILLARGTCGIGFIGLCVNALLPEPSLLAIYLLGLWDGFFASLGVTALLAATPALVGREKSDAGRRDYHADGTSGIGYFPDVGGAYCLPAAA